MSETSKSSRSGRSARKVNTKGKFLYAPMQMRVAQAVERHRGFLVLIAKEQARRFSIHVRFNNGRPEGWFADLVSAGIYGMCRGALAWQQKEAEGLRTTDFDGELRQAARVRVRQMARKIRKGITT